MIKRRNVSQRSELIYDLHNFGVNPDTREIWLNTPVDDIPSEEEKGIDHRNTSIFIKNLRLLESLSKEPILIHMVSIGGCWNYGLAIYDAIKLSTSYTTILAYAHARSMSSIIPQAASKRIIMPNADFLIHDGTLCVDGHYQTVISDIDWAKRDRNRMIEIYIERCKGAKYWKDRKMGEKSIKNWFERQLEKKQDVFISSTESVEMGLMDGILGQVGYENIDKLLCKNE